MVFYRPVRPVQIGSPVSAAPVLREAGIERVVASSHGHEVGWSQLPGGRSLVRAVGSRVDVLTFLTDFTRCRLLTVVPPGTRLARLTGGVDTERFRPGAGGEEIRRDLGWSDRPIVICVARLAERKGQDMLIRGWPAVRQRHPHARLLLVGSRPAGDRLCRLVRMGAADSVRLTGAVPDRVLPAYLDTADVFAMPSRTRLFGLDLEGLGLSALEAAASGLPVIILLREAVAAVGLDATAGMVTHLAVLLALVAGGFLRLSGPPREPVATVAMVVVGMFLIGWLSAPVPASVPPGSDARHDAVSDAVGDRPSAEPGGAAVGRLGGDPVAARRHLVVRGAGAAPTYGGRLGVRCVLRGQRRIRPGALPGLLRIARRGTHRGDRGSQPPRLLPRYSDTG